MRRGPAAITRAWCLFELTTALDLGKVLHVALSPADHAGFVALLERAFDAIAGIVAGVDARDAQISKVDDRPYILERVGRLEAGLGTVTARVAEALRGWVAAAGRRARDALPERGPSALLNAVALLLKQQGELAEAEPLYREALAARREALGERHPSTLTSLNNLAALLKAMGQCDEAESLFRRVLLGREMTLGATHPTTLISDEFSTRT